MDYNVKKIKGKNMEKYYDLICKTPFFNGIPNDKISDVLSEINANVVSFKKNKAIFYEGTSFKAGIILLGEAEIRKQDYKGNNSIISTISVGQMFGEALCCTQKDIIPIGLFSGETCVVLLFDCEKITNEKEFAYKNVLLRNLLSIIAEKNLELRAKINILSKRTTREKIMAFLVSEAKKAGSREFDISFDRQQLADYLGVDRSAMSNEISKLCRDNVIKTSKSHFIIIKES